MRDALSFISTTTTMTTIRLKCSYIFQTATTLSVLSKLNHLRILLIAQMGPISLGSLSSLETSRSMYAASVSLRLTLTWNPSSRSWPYVLRNLLCPTTTFLSFRNPVRVCEHTSIYALFNIQLLNLPSPPRVLPDLVARFLELDVVSPPPPQISKGRVYTVLQTAGDQQTLDDRPTQDQSVILTEAEGFVGKSIFEGFGARSGDHPSPALSGYRKSEFRLLVLWHPFGTDVYPQC